MATQKNLSFGAKTYSGIEISFFACLQKDGKVKFGAKTNTYEHVDAGYFRNDPQHGWIYVIDNQYINEKLIGVKKAGAVKVPNYNVQEVEEIETELNILFNQQIQQQIDSLEDNDIVTLKWTAGGYGSYASLVHEKLSYEATKKFESDVKFINDSKLVKFENTDPFADYGLTLEAKMTYAEFKNLMKQVEEMKSEKQRVKEETELQKKQEIQKVEEEEFMIFDADVILSSTGYKMLHSLGATVSEKNNKITIYTTSYAKSIPNAVTTFDIKEELKNQGFKYDPETKNWEIECTDESANKTFEILKKHDTKVWPSKSGLVRCWECGTYFKPGKNDHDGFDYYCGC